MPSLPPLSDRLLPMLPGRASEPFDSPRHLFELKWAGIRALGHVNDARLRLISRSGREITAWFPELAGMAAQIRGDGLLLDGEIVAFGPAGEPDLGAIAGRLAGAGSEDGHICLYQAYDILFERGSSLMDLPLIERKDALASLIRRPGPAVLTDYVPGDGLALFEAAGERRLPGIVAKEKSSVYTPGSVSGDWLEIPLYEIDNFVVGGYLLGLRGEGAVAGLLLGTPRASGRLDYVAQISGGLEGDLLEPVLSPYTSPGCPFTTVPSLARLVYWLKPELVCQVKFARRQPDGQLRFPMFMTMRPDLDTGTLAAVSAEKQAPRRG